jgi:hypothetical protein
VIILRLLRIEVSVYSVNTANQFQTTLARVEGGGGRGLVEVTGNSKEENSEDFCPNYDQEFGLCTLFNAEVLIEPDFA